MMFMLGSALFGATVLLPQLLQTLMGYSAQDAGMVLSPFRAECWGRPDPAAQALGGDGIARRCRLPTGDPHRQPVLRAQRRQFADPLNTADNEMQSGRIASCSPARNGVTRRVSRSANRTRAEAMARREG